MTTAETYHVPVLLQESIDGLAIQPGGVYVDVTFGGGGHSREILRRLGPEGRLYSFDQDADAADLGVSSHYFDDATRGFSFRFDAPLDMRMNKRAGQTAADILNGYSEEQLADVFYLYGELKNARRIAKTIVTARSEKTIATTGDLLSVLGIETAQADSQLSIVNSQLKKDMARLFQALRIEVNREMVVLTDLLCGARDVLGEGGRLVVITYHSLEDRLVKNMMKSGSVDGRVEQDFFGRVQSPFRPVGKVIVPDSDEQQRNPRSRSAKLRIAERVS